MTPGASGPLASGWSPGRHWELHKAQGGQGKASFLRVGPSCLLHQLALLPIRRRTRSPSPTRPVTTPVIADVQMAFPCVRESRQSRTGQGLCGLTVQFLLKQMAWQWGQRGLKEGVSQSACLRECTPPSASERRGMSPSWPAGTKVTSLSLARPETASPSQDTVSVALCP